MDYQLLLLFIVLSILNVLIQTAKSIATIKCGKTVAAIVNAVAYGLYTIVIVYTNCELDLWLKAGITAAANLVGVYVVKWMEEKARADRLWKVEATVRGEVIDALADDLDAEEISHNFVETSVDNNNYIIVNCYCHNQIESQVVKLLLNRYGAKWFVSETKIL